MTELARPPASRDLSRRTFLLASVAGGFALGFAAPMATATRAMARPSTSMVNTWVQIGSDESITVLVGSSEMGQGVYTSLVQLVAEELHVDWSKVGVAPAPADQAYANPGSGAQVTGGSMSVRGYYTALRTAGAAVRDMLRAAAAQRFGVPITSCVARNGRVHVAHTSKSASYGQLAVAAAKQPVPSNPKLTPPNKLRLIGQPVPRLDIPDKTTGAAIYGIDVRLPGMQHAIVVHAPAVGGTLKSMGPLPAGISAVVKLKNSAGLVDAVGIVAATTWDAMHLRGKLNLAWHPPADASALTTAAIDAKAANLMETGTPLVADSEGNAQATIASAMQALDVTYTVPYVAHATMEVPVCTAHVTEGACEIWAPTQVQGFAAATAAAICGIAPDAVTVHTTMLGGGLGRKLETDFIAQAVQVAKKLTTPVKVTWPREEDFGHDQFRPMARLRVRAGLDGANKVSGWWDRIVTPSILFQRGWIPDGTVDGQATEGSTELPYGFGDRLVEFIRHPAAVPVGFWRSVGHSFNAFAVECAMDELAIAANADPIAFRLAHMSDDPRAGAVLNKVAEMCDWAGGPPAGSARGIAIANAFGSIVAEVAEVSQPSPGVISVDRVWCAIDCGQVVNPDIVEAQMQGGIVHGLTAALWGRITFKNGVASPRNFGSYRMTKMKDMPLIDVAIIPSTEAPGGVGEPGVPPIAPAVANAWARLTGNRVRDLPLQ
jgi:isoquinoline 1-oxidoreductase beta subunit